MRLASFASFAIRYLFDWKAVVVYQIGIHKLEKRVQSCYLLGFLDVFGIANTFHTMSKVDYDSYAVCRTMCIQISQRKMRAGFDYSD